MFGAARDAYLVLAWAFVVGVVVQVFFIGLGLFAGSQNIELHVTLGWILREWLMASDSLAFRLARRLAFPWLARKARTSSMYVHSLASAYRVIAVRS